MSLVMSDFCTTAHHNNISKCLLIMIKDTKSIKINKDINEVHSTLRILKNTSSMPAKFTAILLKINLVFEYQYSEWVMT